MRPRLKYALLGSVASVALLAGCSAAPADDTQTLTFAIEGANLSAGHMDPHSSQLDVSNVVMRGVLDSLVAQSADGAFHPWLAESWEVSDDQLSYTFHLRDDVTFSDGAAFDAEAVKANLDHITDPATASAQAAGMIDAVEGGSYVGTEVVDEHTVRIDYSAPFAPFLSAVATAHFGFWSPEVLASSADELKTGGPDVSVGTGPFVLTEYTPDQQLVFERNDDYDWAPEGSAHTGPAELDELVIRILPETAVRTGALASGEVQVAGNITPSSVQTLGDDAVLENAELPGIPYSLYLNEQYGVFADERVRQAFGKAIDVQAAVDAVFFGEYPRAWSILAPSTPNSYDAALEGQETFDPDAAEALLDEAGWTERDSEGYRVKDGERLSARWIAWTPIPDDRAALADLVQADLRDVGFEIVREALEPAQYNEQYGPRTYDLTDWGFSGVDADALRSHLHTGGFQNASMIEDPAVDELLDGAVATTDPSAREAAYVELQQWNAEHVAIVPLYVPSLITASSPDVEGLEFDLYGRPLFAGATLAE